MAWVALFLTLAAGWFLARALTAGAFPGPRWVSLLLEAGFAALFGPGVASVLYFLLTCANLSGNSAAVLGMLALFTASSAAVWWTTRPIFPPSNTPTKTFPWTWALMLAVAAALALFLADFAAASSANPHGEIDALSIWNLRARFLAGGAETWHRAISPDLGGHLLGAAHPGYPLFLSAFLALQWVAGGDAPDPNIPIAASLLFSLAAFLLLGAGVASKRSASLGAMAWLILLCSEVFVSQAAAQYSDLLQGLAFLAALILIERATELHGSPRMLIAAGLALGLCAWAKNEGLPFALAGLAVAAWKFRGKFAWVILGAVPGALALIILKSIANGREAAFPNTAGEIISKLATPGRWWQTLLGFGKSLIDAGDPWTHPIILTAALIFALRFVPREARETLSLLWLPLAATAAAEYGLYLITTADLDWHISTSVNRLLAQLWPALIWLMLSRLHRPEDYQ